MLLAKTLRSSTFRLALLYIVVFGAVLLGLIGYVYWSASSYVVSGHETDALEAFRHKLDLAVILGLALIFALAGVASVTVTRRTVGRIESINATSRAIMRSGLGERIPIKGTRDEWDELASNLNSMLDRIEALMEQVTLVTDNVAHDLRTPLARIRGRLEKAYRRRPASDEDRSLIGDAITDLDAVLRMFASITRISQIEAYRQSSAFGRVDLAQIASEVVELFDAAAEVRGVRLAVVGDPRVLVFGDRDLLFDALANLVDNAIKHGREAGRVIVEVEERDDGAALSVIDDGSGIPANEFRAVFKRFYRLERSRGTPGNGLGLSLVAAVARVHGARIEMTDNQPGLKMQILFPAPATAELGGGE